ncbi:MAG TPA: hypothetical protein VEY68_02385 [Anoxybacillus sp.]|nr:hypothetical protein [Anoxybacillus sp.]
MRKWGFLLLGIILLLFGYLVYMDVYNTHLPVSSVSEKEVLNKITKSSGNLVKITEEKGYQWYITEKKQGKEYEELKQMMKEKGWFYKKRADSGFIFHNINGEINVKSRLWKKNYVIFYFPEGI